MSEAHESITDAIQYGHKLRANMTIYQPRAGLAEKLRRLGNDVVEMGDYLLVNQTGSPVDADRKAVLSTRRMY